MAISAILASLFSGASAAQASTADDARDALRHDGFGQSLLTVAHLGAWRDAPENSIPAIEKAVEMGVEIVELDVKRTNDGGLVLMHDDLIDRTTDGSGKVSDHSLEEIRGLHLRELRGGDAASLTDLGVPTFGEALDAVGDESLINADKAWDYREEVWNEAAAHGKTDQVLFKSDAPVSEVDEFLTAHPDALYCHIINDGNTSVAHTFVREPDCYEVVWDSADDAQVASAYLAGLQSTSRVWMNTMWRGLSGGYTDESALRDQGDWGAVTALGASVIQTDHPEALIHWRDGGRASGVGLTASSVRVQAEDYATGGADQAYSDQDAENRGNADVRPDEGVDVCEEQGNVHVCWIREGEWVRYDVTIPESGDYRISAHVSSKYRPAGRISLEFGSGTTSASTQEIDLRTTTGHGYFLDQELVPSQHMEAGAQSFTMRVSEGTFQNFNVDYWQFDRL